VFTRRHRDSDSETLRIYSHGHSRRLIDGGGSAAWSVRNEIVFVRVTRADDPPVIYSVRPDGTGLRRLAVGSQPNWSPDGRRLAFVAPGSHIATVSREGTRRRSVTKNKDCLDSSPSFSPGGGQLAFVRHNADGCPRDELVTSRTDGSRMRGRMEVLRGDLAFRDVGYALDWQPLRRRR
jgi:Tol biopolymer transport system component